MAKYSPEEWWAIYCLRFGVSALEENYAEGEREFLEQVSVDISYPPEVPDDPETASRTRRLRIIELFAELRREGLIAARKP